MNYSTTPTPDHPWLVWTSVVRGSEFDYPQVYARTKAAGKAMCKSRDDRMAQAGDRGRSYVERAEPTEGGAA